MEFPISVIRSGRIIPPARIAFVRRKGAEEKWFDADWGKLKSRE
jgi:hypothetical protein